MRGEKTQMALSINALVLFQIDPQSSPFPAERCPGQLSLRSCFQKPALQNKQIPSYFYLSLPISCVSDEMHKMQCKAS